MKIKGYRELNEEEITLINEIKSQGVLLEELVGKLELLHTLDQRWIEIGAANLQVGLMALTRAVAKPTSF